MPRNRRKTDEQKRRLNESREELFFFMRNRFHANLSWEMHGPKNTSIETIYSFVCYHPEKNADDRYEILGVVLVQLYEDGSWGVFADISGSMDDISTRILGVRAIRKMHDALKAVQPEIDREIEDRQHGGNAEAYFELEKISDKVHDAIKAGDGWYSYKHADVRLESDLQKADAKWDANTAPNHDGELPDTIDMAGVLRENGT